MKTKSINNHNTTHQYTEAFDKGKTPIVLTFRNNPQLGCSPSYQIKLTPGRINFLTQFILLCLVITFDSINHLILSERTFFFPQIISINIHI